MSQKCHCKAKLECFVLCKDKWKRKTSSIIRLSETGTVGWLRFALQCCWHLTDRASNRKSVLTIYGKTNCQEIHCAKSFFFLSDSFTAVGDEEKLEFLKRGWKYEANNKWKTESLWSQRLTEALRVSLSVCYRSVMCNGAAEREVRKSKPPLHKQIMGWVHWESQRSGIKPLDPLCHRPVPLPKVCLLVFPHSSHFLLFIMCSSFSVWFLFKAFSRCLFSATFKVM